LFSIFFYKFDTFPVLVNGFSSRNPTTARSLLPQIISAFGDFALLLGDSFAQYRGQVIETLIQACQAEVDLNDPDMIDYLNLLRQSCIETFVGLIQGARSSGNGNQYPSTAQENIEKFQLIIPHMQFIITFMEHIAAQQVSSEELIGWRYRHRVRYGFSADHGHRIDQDATVRLSERSIMWTGRSR